MDGEELVSGQSPGPNVAVNTKASIYIGESWAQASVRQWGPCRPPAHAFLSPGALPLMGPALSPPPRRSPPCGHTDQGQVLLGRHGLSQEPGAALRPAW